MGRNDVSSRQGPSERREFTRALLRDLQALERMLSDGRIESGVRRIGAEQELFLVDRGWRPAPVAPAVLDGLDQPQFTTELARFNLEINLAPLALGGSCFRDLHRQLDSLVGEVRREAQRLGADVVLTGILPTLAKSDLSLDSITPRERYYALNDALSEIRGACYRLHIQGADELNLEHESVMLEACNTSFQVHLQVDAEEFAHVYNVAQAVTAPVLASAANSPLLFGRQLWAETRIALFQQSIDTRRTTPHLRELTPRVRFGERWASGSVAELYREDILRIPALIVSGQAHDALEALRGGEIPELAALQLYNSTVYRWNRPCFGVSKGRAHLRIECRVLPSGPSISDEVANAMFWVGSVLGLAAKLDDITEVMRFDDARANLLAAARRGSEAGFIWIDDRAISARQLVLDELLPIASEGLLATGVDGEDVVRYLGIIRDRIDTRLTGAHWLQRSVAHMSDSGSRTERMAALTGATVHRQRDGRPGHEWALADIAEGGGSLYNYSRVEQYMTTDLFTVKEDELVELAALMMDWKRIRQVPVEDDDRRLVGLVTYGAVLRLFTSGAGLGGGETVSVKEIMDPDPLSVSPETSTRTVIRVMRENAVTSLPVVKDGRLVGIVTVDDFLPIAERLLAELEVMGGAKS